MAIIVVCIGCLSCDAPHDNPLDPESDRYQEVRGPLYDADDFQARVRSLHTAFIFPTTSVYRVHPELWTNEEIPIDSAWVVFADTLRGELSRTIEGVWSTVLHPTFFNPTGDPRMESVIGKPFLFEVMIHEDTTYQVGPEYLFRVITEIPTLVSPISGDTVEPFVTAAWEPFGVPYPFNFRVSLWRNEPDFVAEIWTSDTLAATRTQTALSDSLQNGEYFWTLFVIDEFGNYSRSREGEFRVETEGVP